MSSPVDIRAANDPNKKGLGILLQNVDQTLQQAGQQSVDRTAYAYAKTYEKWIAPVGEGLTDVSKGLSNVSDTISSSLNDASATIRKALEPISDFMGSTLGTLTGILNDPLGPKSGLGNIATNLLNNVSPGYGDKVNNTLKAYGVDTLVNLPQTLFSNVDHLITAVDNILAIPLQMLAEVYYGFMDIMKEISNLLSTVMNAFQQFIMDFLDSIIPIKSILALLDSISNLANQIGGIAGTFLGANPITGFTQQITQFTRSIGSVLANPMSYVIRALPAEVTNAINLIQSPQNLINSFLPPQLSQAFSTISKMTGFGFNGNMGFGFESVLQGLQGGVLRSILSKYAQQYNVIAPLLAGAGNAQTPAYIPKAILNRYNSGYQDEIWRARTSSDPNAHPQYNRTGP
jgi:phage-related protein